jgi:hypothetical protein
LPKRLKSKYKKFGLSTTKPGSLLKKQAPIKLNKWDERKPGFIEADTVAHCGNSVSGQFVYSLNIVDIATGWTEQRDLWGKGQRSVFEVLRDIRKLLPYKILGFVNGSGTTTEKSFYSFTDQSPVAGKSYYKLKQIDFDGSFEYSNIVEVEFSLPIEFSLEQNYPKPFNPSTKIKYTIPNVTLSGVEGSRVALKVYDVLGNEIATLVNEEKQPGNYEVNFDASKFSSGVYFYEIRVENPSTSSGEGFVQTKKMILLR